MRRKQLFAVLMAGSMAASLAACGKTDTKKTTAATEKKMNLFGCVGRY